MSVILQESLRGLLYAPYYAAMALGAYRGEGVAVDFVSATTPAEAPAGLFAGTVDVAWGGPMRVMQMYESRADCDLVCFGEVVTRDPFLLIGREPRPDFALADLYGKRVATVSEVPTPWLCLQEDLRRAGLDPDALPRVADRTMADNAAALAARRTRCRAAVRALCRGADRRRRGPPLVRRRGARPDGIHKFLHAAQRARRAARGAEETRARRSIARRNGSHYSRPRRSPMRCNRSFRACRRPCCAPRWRAIGRSASGAATRSCHGPAMTG